jgi:hypothetical protein
MPTWRSAFQRTQALGSHLRCHRTCWHDSGGTKQRTVRTHTLPPSTPNSHALARVQRPVAKGSCPPTTNHRLQAAELLCGLPSLRILSRCRRAARMMPTKCKSLDMQMSMQQYATGTQALQPSRGPGLAGSKMQSQLSSNRILHARADVLDLLQHSYEVCKQIMVWAQEQRPHATLGHMRW